MTIWQRFQDPVWKSQAEKLQHKNAGGTWQVEKTDDKKTKQHKNRTNQFLMSKGLNEEKLFKEANVTDIALMNDILKMEVIDYISDHKVPHFNHLKNQVLVKKQALTDEQLQQLSYILQNAQRKQLNAKTKEKRAIHRTKKTYEQYKANIENCVYKYKTKKTLGTDSGNISGT